MIPPTSDKRLNVAESPHWRDGSALWRTQVFWTIGLLPAAVAAVWSFGMPALKVLGLATAAAVTFDALAGRVLPSKDLTSNWSSVPIGLLLGMLLPLNCPWWLVLIAAFLAIVVGKKLYGGWGAYPVHPVALSYAMLAVSWPERLDRTGAFAALAREGVAIEPVRLLKTQGATAEQAFDVVELLLGHQVAGAGNAMVLWLALGGLFLVLVRIVPWHIPFGTLLGVVGGAWLIGQVAPYSAASPVFHLVAGSTAMMAFFLLGESTTSPVNRWPMVLFGVLAGGLLVLIRTFSIHHESAVFAVLLANLASPLLDRMAPRVKGLEVTGDA